MSAALAEMLSAPIDPRSIRVRFSRLKLMAASPLHYWHACQDLDHRDSLAMRIGRGGHALLFDQPCVRYDGIRRSKEWDAFQADHADSEILNAKEWDQATQIADAIRRHPLAGPLLLDGMVHERPVEWEHGGRGCVSTPDAFGPAGLVDLKTTQCAEPSRFTRDGMKRAYHAQLAFYCRALGWSGPVHIVAIESKPPYPVTVFSLDQETLELGERSWRLWFEQLLACELAGQWPAYSDAVVPFTVVDDDARLIIDGEEVEL